MHAPKVAGYLPVAKTHFCKRFDYRLTQKTVVS